MIAKLVSDVAESFGIDCDIGSARNAAITDGIDAVILCLSKCQRRTGAATKAEIIAPLINE